MTDALIVNPFDADAIAEAMHRALTRSLEERQDRHRGLRQNVWHSTASRQRRRLVSFPPRHPRR